MIFVTAYSLFQYAHEAMHLGACDYLLKPVNPDEVEASIRKAIRQIEAGRRLAELAPVEPEPEADPEERCRRSRGERPQCTGHGPCAQVYGG